MYIHSYFFGVWCRCVLKVRVVKENLWHELSWVSDCGQWTSSNLQWWNVPVPGSLHKQEEGGKSKGGGREKGVVGGERWWWVVGGMVSRYVQLLLTLKSNCNSWILQSKTTLQPSIFVTVIQLRVGWPHQPSYSPPGSFHHNHNVQHINFIIKG